MDTDRETAEQLEDLVSHQGLGMVDAVIDATLPPEEHDGFRHYLSDRIGQRFSETYLATKRTIREADEAELAGLVERNDRGAQLGRFIANMLWRAGFATGPFAEDLAACKETNS